MATKVLKMYKTSSPFQSFDSSNYVSYYVKDSFQYNPRSLLTKNPRYNKFYAAYFANSMSSRRRSSSRIRKMNSPARSASSTSSSSSSSSASGPRSKTSVSPPPAKSSSSSSSSSASHSKTGVSPPPAKASSPASSLRKAPIATPAKPSSSAPRFEAAGPPLAANKLGSPQSAELTDSSPPAKGAVSPTETAPSSVSSAPSKSSLSSPLTLPHKRVSKKRRAEDEISETKSKKIYIKFVDPSKSHSAVVQDGENTKGGFSKAPRADDDDDDKEAIAKPSLKKRRTTKKFADPSKEDLEKIRSDSLRKRRKLAAAVREDSQRMASAAQRGLFNVTGFACYRNSLLQGLLHLPKFFNFLVDQHPVETCVNPRKDCLACALSLLSSKYWTIGVPRKEITAMLTSLEVQCKRLGWNPGPSGQGDPHDQVTWMLEKINEQITASSVASMQSIMQLVLSSRITCDNCHNISVGDLQDELALSVPLKPRIRGGSLSSYLHKYLDETIEGYRCEKCKVMGDVHRVQSISHAPDILFIQLKRFGYDGRKDKLTLPIDHTLDLSPYRDPSGSKDSMEYELIAFVSHEGTLNSGHYICDARGPDGRWNCFNDIYQCATTLTRALKDNQPYLLFYQRKQT